jgi:hypothetical protein
MRVLVATHGHCFDGLVSAALFTRLHQHVAGRRHEYIYRACGYAFNQYKPDEAELTYDEHAILDYRLSPSSRVDWYFDHHRTALQIPGTRELYEGGHARQRMFVDADYSSCAKLIMDVARQEFGLAAPELDELVEWADRIDAARFEDAAQAISQEHPVRRFVRVVEHAGNDPFLRKIVPDLLNRPLQDIAESSAIRKRYRPLGKSLDRFVKQLREKCEQRGRVVFADLSDGYLDSAGKFVTYAMFPDSVYSVLLGRQGNGAKILVGYNPWSGRPRDADISAICARYGGGGHPYVGGIPFRETEYDRARLAAREIVSELEG